MGEGEDVLDEAAFLGNESAVMLDAGLPPAAACLLLPPATLFGEQLVQVVSRDFPRADDAGHRGVIETVGVCFAQAVEVFASQPYAFGDVRRQHRQTR